MSPFFTSARTASETNPIKARSGSPIARTDRTANDDPVSSKFETVALSVHGSFETCRRDAMVSSDILSKPPSAVLYAGVFFYL